MKQEVLEHWNRVACGSQTEKVGADDCPYCRRFYKDGCEGCPIYLATGHSLCSATPYATIFLRYYYVRDGDYPWQAAVAGEIEEMIELIESLPEDI